MVEKCFCHLGEFKVKDADARAALEELKTAIKNVGPSEEVKTELASIQSKLKALELAVDALDDLNNGNETVDLSGITNAIAELESDVNDIRNEINTNGDYLSQIEEHIIPEIQTNVTDLENTVKDLNQRIQSLPPTKKYLHKLRVDFNAYDTNGNTVYSQPYGAAVIKLISADDTPITKYSELKALENLIIAVNGEITTMDNSGYTFQILNVTFEDTGTRRRLKIHYLDSFGEGLRTHLFNEAEYNTDYAGRIEDIVTEF